MRSIFGGSILLILSNTQYFWGVDTAYTKKYAVFQGVDTAYIEQCAVHLGDRYYLYKAIRSIFGEWILLILSNAQYFLGINTVYTK